jgi:hypothetical protein
MQLPENEMILMTRYGVMNNFVPFTLHQINSYTDEPYYNTAGTNNLCRLGSYTA